MWLWNGTLFIVCFTQQEKYNHEVINCTFSKLLNKSCVVEAKIKVIENMSLLWTLDKIIYTTSIPP